MAREFTKDLSNYVQFGVGTFNTLFSGASRIAFHCVFNVDSLSTAAQGNNRLLNVSLNSTGTAALILALRSASASVLHIRARSSTADTLQDASATTTITTGAWHYAGGVIDYAGDTIQPYYDGVAEGGGAVTFAATTFTSGSPITNQDSMGGDATTPPADTNRQIDGRLAEFAIWKDVVPSAADFAALAKGASPLLIARSGLLSYWRMVGDEGIKDIVGATNPTITGSIPKAEHPRMFYGRKFGGIFKITAGGPTQTPVSLAAAVTLTPAMLRQTSKILPAAVTLTAALQTAPTPTFDSSFERSSFNPTGSSITDVGDSALIYINPKVQESEVVSSQTRWLFPLVRVNGIRGYRPTFRFLNYADPAADGKYHGVPWQTGRRPYYSYDLSSWTAFDTNVTVNATNIEFRNSAAFTSGADTDPVYISWGRTRTPSDVASWVTDLESTYPTLIHNVPSNTSGFISGTIASQTDSLGNTIPATSLYAFKVSDSSLTPASGSKRTFVLMSGVHAGEDQGDLALMYAVEFLLGSDAQAQNARQHADWIIYPMQNPTGRYGGGWRGEHTQGTGGADDPNRHATDGNEDGLATVLAIKAAFDLDLPSIVQAMIDFHGDFGFHGLTKQFALFTNDTAGDTLFTAVETYIGSANLHDYGTSTVESFPKHFNNNYGTFYRATFEVGEPVPFSDATLQAGGEAIIKALSDLITSGDIPELNDVSAAATITLTPTMLRQTNKILAAMMTLTANLTTGGTQFLVDLVATVALTPAFVKEVGKGVAAAVTVVPEFIRQMGVALSATTISTAGTAMSVGKTVAATVSLVPTLVASFVTLITLAATVTLSAALSLVTTVAPVVVRPFTGFAGVGWMGGKNRWSLRKRAQRPKKRK